MAKQTTFSGEVLTHDTMTHQHLSNCVWHFRVWRNAPDANLSHFFDTLKRRFKGVLLPWRPILRFEAEIKALHENNMVIPRDEYSSDIKWKGEIIGEVFNSFEAEKAWGEKLAYDKEIETLTKKPRKKRVKK